MGILRAIKLTWIICIFIGTGFITEIASAGVLLYGTTSNGDSGTSTLVLLNTDDWENPDEIGPVGYLVNGMAWDYQTQSLYASTSTNDPAFTGLIVIDRATGVGTAVSTSDWGQGAGFSVSNITIDSDGNMVGWADNTNQLVAIDKETGEITQFIDTSVSAAEFGLSYAKYNLLYLVNNGDSGDLYVFVDEDQDFTDGPSVGYEGRQGDFHPTTNLYYGIDHTGTDTRSLVTIYVAGDEDNFQETFETVDQLHTLAFAVTRSGSSGNGDSGICFIRSITNTD
ncbi:MAG: hypothetical protein PVG41_07185 [Desulfobacteraceae bacterium]